MTNQLTIPEKILVAARGLAGNGTFSAEDLVVEAWENFPSDFGLQGYSNQYPDSNRVLTKIMGGESTLRKNGWLEKVGTKTYRLSEVGRLKAEALQGREHRNVARLAGLSRELARVLRRVVHSSALAKFPDEKDRISFGDLSTFYKISPRSTASQLAVREAEVRKAIGMARNSATEVEGLLAGGGVIVDEESLDQLDALRNFLETRFQRELAVIRSRTDERNL